VVPTKRRPKQGATLAAMVRVSMSLLALASPGAAVTAKLSKDLDMNTKTRPIMKVVRMLEDMKEELNKELEDDKAVQELLECWCGTGMKEKEKSIQLAESRISELEAALGEALAKINELKSKRKATQEEQYADQKTLDEAEEMRMKENKAFHETEGDFCKLSMQLKMPSPCSANTTPDSHRLKQSLSLCRPRA